MQQRVDRLSDHTIVCGYGRMGVTICDQLADEGGTFVVVEQHEHAIDEARRNGFPCVQGCATDDDTLLAAGVQRAQWIVAAADSEATNIVVTLSARELNPGITVIARAERDEEVRKLLRAGATHVVSPFQSGGLEVAHRIMRPRVADLLIAAPHAKARVGLSEISVEPGSVLDGVQLSDYGRRSGTRVSFVALERPDEDTIVRPPGTLALRAGDLLVVAGSEDDLVAMKADGIAAKAA